VPQQIHFAVWCFFHFRHLPNYDNKEIWQLPEQLPKRAKTVTILKDFVHQKAEGENADEPDIF
jgi:hypothetical protein